MKLTVVSWDLSTSLSASPQCPAETKSVSRNTSGNSELGRVSNYELPGSSSTWNISCASQRLVELLTSLTKSSVDELGSRPSERKEHRKYYLTRRYHAGLLLNKPRAFSSIGVHLTKKVDKSSSLQGSLDLYLHSFSSVLLRNIPRLPNWPHRGAAV